MANQQQLDILRQGEEVWNQWRLNNPDVQIDLSGADLTNASFRDADLHDAKLDRVFLVGANLANANLDSALQPHFANSQFRVWSRSPRDQD